MSLFVVVLLPLALARVASSLINGVLPSLHQRLGGRKNLGVPRHRFLAQCLRIYYGVEQLCPVHESILIR